ncbi:MAG: esterase-like activity of phytase family protein [Bacteroidota bacterium]
MKAYLPHALFTFLLSLATVVAIQAQGMDLQYLSTYNTNIFDEAAAEIVSYDATSSRLFFTNSDANTITIVDISDPLNPVFVADIDLSTYGGGINSVAVSNGIVAAAVEAMNTQDNGSVVFFDTGGNYINDVEAGALPDMLTFTPDGTKVVVANEGEPDDDYLVDPEGSITIIDISTGAANATTMTATFTAFNDKKASLLNRGVRIFGPNATVAQDLEPEYITISEDNSIAYVALQENNAMAVVDLASATVLDILPFGLKDHATGTPTLQEFKFNELVDLPALGVPVYDGVEQDTVFLGGFSGLYFDPTESTDTKYTFYVIPDRGPNEAAVSSNNVFSPASPDIGALQNLRPFKLPDYQGRIAKFSLDLTDGSVTLEDQILLRRMQGEQERSITGKGNVIGIDEVPVEIARFIPDSVTDYTTISGVDYVDTTSNIAYKELQYDPYGGDFEGILKDVDGNFWMCDEYRPAVYKFAPDGMLIERYIPEGTADLTIPILGFSFGAGFYGQETLPAVYGKRRANRGFEALAYDADNNLVYAFIQSPLYNPNSSTRNNSDIIRVLGIDATSGAPVSEYVYVLERNRDAGVGTRVDKIGDAVYIGNGKFLIIERDSSVPGEDTGKKYIYEMDITGATNLLTDFSDLSAKSESTGEDDKTLEMMTADDLAAAGIQTIFKRKIINLPSIGYQPSDKAEGIALLPNGSIAVMNDNDFGLAGAGVSDDSSLGIISFGTNNALDASNRDDVINIDNYPVFGMYMPDAITSFNQNGINYILTANEGDARDYDGYSEEERIGDFMLDTTRFPNAVELLDDANLGRLNSTTSAGDLDNDGDKDYLLSYGARSFSVFDETGNLVFDSGNDFEVVTSQFGDGAFFNSNNDDNDSFDARSDDKGPEPEAVEIGMIGDDRYAFIGMERIGGIAVYEINDPTAPQYMSYINNRNFAVPTDSSAALDLGVEDILFISIDDSPVALPLVVTANEVSGTVSIFSIGQLVDVEEIDPEDRISWRVFPNPVSNTLFSNIISDYQVITIAGQVLKTVQNTNQINLSDLPRGSYLLRNIKKNESKLFVKQ